LSFSSLDYYRFDVASKFSSRLETVLWWEDFTVGETSDMGSHRFAEAEIVAFARQFDPQPFHTDAEAAARSAFGLVKHRWEARNQDGELVLSMEGWGMFGRKPAL
jgi:acyl dehydratase